jgi:hypothetical protein
VARHIKNAYVCAAAARRHHRHLVIVAAVWRVAPLSSLKQRANASSKLAKIKLCCGGGGGASLAKNRGGWKRAAAAARKSGGGGITVKGDIVSEAVSIEQ